jgi:hypothetical protein
VIPDVDCAFNEIRCTQLEGWWLCAVKLSCTRPVLTRSPSAELRMIASIDIIAYYYHERSLPVAVKVPTTIPYERNLNALLHGPSGPDIGNIDMNSGNYTCRYRWSEH